MLGYERENSNIFWDSENSSYRIITGMRTDFGMPNAVIIKFTS